MVAIVIEKIYHYTIQFDSIHLAKSLFVEFSQNCDSIERNLYYDNKNQLLSNIKLNNNSLNTHTHTINNNENYSV